jgi:hypothetical protein
MNKALILEERSRKIASKIEVGACVMRDPMSNVAIMMKKIVNRMII